MTLDDMRLFARVAEAKSFTLYVARAGQPSSPDELRDHQCILVQGTDTTVRWPFVRDRGFMVPISGRLRFNSFAIAHAAARAGLGIAIFRVHLRRGHPTQATGPGAR